jgi:hypothetical protein
MKISEFFGKKIKTPHIFYPLRFVQKNKARSKKKKEK